MREGEKEERKWRGRREGSSVWSFSKIYFGFMSPCVDKNPIVPGSFPLLLLSSIYSSATPLLHLLSTLLLHLRLGGVIRSRSSLQIVRRFWAAKNVTMVMRFWLKPDNSINRHRRQDLRASTPGLLAITSSSSLLCVSSFLRPKYTKCVPNVAGWVRMQKNYIGICCCRRRRLVIIYAKGNGIGC